MVCDISKEGGLKEAAIFQSLGFELFTSAENRCAFRLSDFYVLKDFFHLGLVDLASHLGVCFPRKAHLDLVKPLHCLFDESVIDAFLDKYPGACAAHLALVKEDAHLQAVHGHLPVTVLKEDIG